MTRVQYYIESRIIITFLADKAKSEFLVDSKDLMNTINNEHNYKIDPNFVIDQNYCLPT
jgi:hypothetical protein